MTIRQILNDLDGNSKNHFPAVILRLCTFPRDQRSRSLRGNSFHYCLNQRAVNICFIYRFCIEREIVKTNDRLKSCSRYIIGRFVSPNNEMWSHWMLMMEIVKLFPPSDLETIILFHYCPNKRASLFYIPILFWDGKLTTSSNHANRYI